jgi:hypothetical protein
LQAPSDLSLLVRVKVVGAALVKWAFEWFLTQVPASEGAIATTFYEQARMGGEGRVNFRQTCDVGFNEGAYRVHAGDDATSSGQVVVGFRLDNERNPEAEGAAFIFR